MDNRSSSPRARNNPPYGSTTTKRETSTQPPHQLTSGGEYRAFFGRPGEIIYHGTEKSPHLMRMNEDGGDKRVLSDLVIMQLQSVSPKAQWAVVGVTQPGGHGERNTMAVAVPLGGGPPVTLCQTCTFGFGVARFSAPFVTWTDDEKTAFVPVRYFGLGSGKTLAIPTLPGFAASRFRQWRRQRRRIEANPRGLSVE